MNGVLSLGIMRQRDFSGLLKLRIKDTIKQSSTNPHNKESNERLDKLHSEDLDRIIDLFWEELSSQLKKGVRVIFDGWISIFTKPVKRSTYDSKIDNTRKTVYAHRVRFKPLELFRKKAETVIDKEEYTKLK